MKPLIVANWKMNPLTLKEAKSIFSSVKAGIKGIKNAEVVISPPFLYLAPLKSASSFLFAAQDAYWEDKGAFTGEISALMLKNAGCGYAIIGHSERRKYFHETDESVNKKIKAAVKTGLTPILCVGETQSEKERGETESVLRKEIASALENISDSEMEASKIVIAYEPVWAIGSGTPCSFDQAKSAAGLIRNIIRQKYPSLEVQKLRILYGGSVNGGNASGYIKEAGVNGLLIGGASLIPSEFVKIVESSV